MSHPEKIEDDMSMDEILASIRRIISEENKGEEKPVFHKTEESEPIPFPTPHLVVPQTQAPEPTVPQEVAQKPFLSAAKETILGFPKEGRPEFSSTPPVFGNFQPMASNPPQAPSMAHIAQDQETVSPSAQEMPKEELPHIPVPPAFESSAQNSQLQAFIYDLIQPLLKDWVNAYLPSLIEKAVAQEVSKMFQKLREP